MGSSSRFGAKTCGLARPNPLNGLADHLQAHESFSWVMYVLIQPNYSFDLTGPLFYYSHSDLSYIILVTGTLIHKTNDLFPVNMFDDPGKTSFAKWIWKKRTPLQSSYFLV